MVNVTERMRAFWRDREWSHSHRIDHYLTENLPRLAQEHQLATEDRIRPIDEQIARHHGSVRDLEAWQSDAVGRLEGIKRRIGRLEVRYGLGAK